MLAIGRYSSAPETKTESHRSDNKRTNACGTPSLDTGQ